MRPLWCIVGIFQLLRAWCCHRSRWWRRGRWRKLKLHFRQRLWIASSAVQLATPKKKNTSQLSDRWMWHPYCAKACSPIPMALWLTSRLPVKPWHCAHPSSLRDENKCGQSTFPFLPIEMKHRTISRHLSIPWWLFTVKPLFFTVKPCALSISLTSPLSIRETENLRTAWQWILLKSIRACLRLSVLPQQHKFYHGWSRWIKQPKKATQNNINCR